MLYPGKYRVCARTRCRCLPGGGCGSGEEVIVLHYTCRSGNLGGVGSRARTWGGKKSGYSRAVRKAPCTSTRVQSMYACMYVCMYVYMYVCADVHMRERPVSSSSSISTRHSFTRY